MYLKLALMHNWELIARARGIDVSAEEMDRLTGVLDALEAAWAPLREIAPHQTEPAIVYRLSRQERGA
jgi:hypothetical protein